MNKQYLATLEFEVIDLSEIKGGQYEIFASGGCGGDNGNCGGGSGCGGSNGNCKPSEPIELETL